MKNRLVFWLITVFMSVLVLYSLVSNVALPVMTKNQLPKAGSHLYKENIKEVKKEDKKKKASANISKDETNPDSSIANIDKSSQSKLFELKKSEQFFQSLLNLVNDDSSYLVLDIIKKTATLEIKGISLYECQIVDSHISSSIKDQPAGTLLNWMAEPFFLKYNDATITKASLVEIIAPKDTLEANKRDETPRAPKRDDVYIIMDFERNLRLVILQAEKPDKEGSKNIRALQWKYKKNEIAKSLNALIHLNREPTMPTIEIVVPKEDATILYRALPYRPKMLLRL